MNPTPAGVTGGDDLAGLIADIQLEDQQGEPLRRSDYVWLGVVTVAVPVLLVLIGVSL